MENYFGIFLILGGGINANGGPQPPQDTWTRQAAQARGGGLCPPRKLVGALLRAQGSLYPGKIMLKSERNQSYGSPGI